MSIHPEGVLYVYKTGADNVLEEHIYFIVKITFLSLISKSWDYDHEKVELHLRIFIDHFTEKAISFISALLETVTNFYITLV